jgi:hypothetical protein
MDQYFTEVNVKDLGWRIDHQQKLMMVGSCFAENIGQKMLRLKFQVDLNPFGILYNPQSVSKSLRLLMEGKVYTAADLFEHEGIWHSFDHHGRFSSTSVETTLEKINKQAIASRQHLKESDFLIISFGTSWIFELKKNGEIVSNCHKLPASDFKRLRLTPGEIIEDYKELILSLLKFNPNLKVLFTVSPVRHWKDGAVENQLSKATLLLAIDRLVTGFGEEKCAYFPSYEIMMDELRDYRFYATDMLHVSGLAIEHIWKKFSKIMIAEKSEKIIKMVTKITKSIEHRPLNPGAKTYVNFLLANLNEINNLLKNFPFLNFEEEKKYFELELDGYQGKSLK